VRVRHGVRAGAGLANVQLIVSETNKALARDPEASGDSIAALGVQRPAEIVNYRSMGSPPIILASGLAAGAIVALAMTLAATVRRRRRDLALLKALGFTHRQLRACVAWDATVVAAAGVVIGVPGGIALGRQLWILFAHSIYAVPEPTVPALALILVAFGALLLANLAAALPGGIAAKTPPSLLLRAE
jgi:ABC-type antimicrobial peptide transport system permease subunit